MKKIVIYLLATLVAIYIAATFVSFNPQEQRPGLSLSGQTGDMASWQTVVANNVSFGEQQVFVQTHPWYLIPHSVTTTMAVHNKRLFIPCRSCADKTWPKHVAADPNVVFKHNDRLYNGTINRVADMPTLHSLMPSQGNHNPDVWVFEFSPKL